MKKNLEAKRCLVVIALVLCQLCLCIYFGHLKRNFFCDEIYSYGLANNTEYLFIDYDTVHENGRDGWVDREFFTDYVTVEENGGYSLKGAIENQKKDVHPPLYYILLYTVNWLNAGHFSKWSGIGLNLCILLVIDLLLYYISHYFLKDEVKSVLAVALWSCSAAGLSNILFIRMYLLMTAEVIAYVASHVLLLRTKKEHPNRVLKLVPLILIPNVIAGGLTHYYYYLFVFFFSAPICLWLLYKRKLKKLLVYSGSLMAAFAINLLVFPATLDHVFSGYRGTEAIKNLQGRSENALLDYYLKWIDESMFGGMWKLLLGILAVTFLYKLGKRYFKISFSSQGDIRNISIEKRNISSKKKIDLHFGESDIAFLVTIFSVLMFILVSTQGSELKSNRYIYPIYPFIAILIIRVVSWIWSQWGEEKTEHSAVAIIAAIICIASIRTYGIDFQYSDYDAAAEKADSVQGYDCLLYYGDIWLDVSTCMPLKFVYDETYFFRKADISNMNEILAARETKNPVVICLPDEFSDEESENMLKELENICGYTGHELIYHYYTQAYLMHE